MEREVSEKLMIGECGPQDVHLLHAIDGICFPADIAFSRSELFSYIKHRDSITRVARLNDVIVGFAIGRIDDPHSAHILTLDVVPGMRRCRIGTALIASLHEEFSRKGMKISILEVDVRNTAARRFYERLDYRQVELLPGYYNGRSDACRMVRILAPAPAG